MSKSTIQLHHGASEPGWDHPTSAREAGMSDASRGRSALLGEKRRFSKEYADGYREMLAWKRTQDPLRFRLAEEAEKR